MVGVSLRRKFSSPGATTIESAERIGMRPVMNEARPAVQLAWPYQLVNTAPSLAIRSTLGVGWPRAAPPPALRPGRGSPAAPDQPISICDETSYIASLPSVSSDGFRETASTTTTPITARHACEGAMNRHRFSGRPRAINRPHPQKRFADTLPSYHRTCRGDNWALDLW